MKRIGLFILCMCLAAGSVIIYHFCFVPRLAYIDIPKVFNGFNMKSEMQKKFDRTENMRKSIIDSLSMELQVLSNRVKAHPKDPDVVNEFDRKRQYFFTMKNRAEEDNAALSAQYDKQILEQMSAYIMEYGKGKNYDFIYGSSGNGVLMFANEQYNISDDIILFINDKYNGIK